MSVPTAEPLHPLLHLAEKLALELVFAEPGKDDGLLPVHNLLGQFEEAAAGVPLDTRVREAISLARTWIERIFDTSGLFDAVALQRFAIWVTWLQDALKAAQARQEVPAWPEAFHAPINPAPAGASLVAVMPWPAETDEGILLNVERDGELLREFTTESREHLQNIELAVLTLEEKPDDADTINSIFRAFHTFKGGSGFLNLRPINQLAHELESLLDLARKRELAVTSDVIDVILAGGDLLKQFVTEIETRLHGRDPSVPICISTEAVRARVRAVLTGPASADAPVGPAPPTPPNPVAAGTTPPRPASAKAEAGGGSSFVKVDTRKLDALVDLVGEMVITQSLVTQSESWQGVQNPVLTRHLAQLGRISKELQRTAMAMRMVPLRATFQKMTRLVRDLTVKAGKQVELRMAGEETELDRTISEEISDPLVHMIRNAVDHGIENAATRVAAGKPPQGTLWLRAFHQGGNIVIQVQDDGAGLNRERILAKAIAQGLATPDEPLTDKDVFNFIFAPGFSTAEKVTDISGRGVGMDVVRRNIEKLRGKAEIQSTPGQGCMFTVFLPLTLAIIEGLIVSVGPHRYILPALSVRESFRPAPGAISTLQERHEVVSVRGKLLPLLRLHEHFDVVPETTDPGQGIIVVIESGRDQRGLLVDRLLSKQEVVIKSLSETLPRTECLAGATILGDGRVGLILDVAGLIRMGREPLRQAA